MQPGRHRFLPRRFFLALEADAEASAAPAASACDAMGVVSSEGVPPDDDAAVIAASAWAALGVVSSEGVPPDADAAGVLSFAGTQTREVRWATAQVGRRPSIASTSTLIESAVQSFVKASATISFVGQWLM